MKITHGRLRRRGMFPESPFRNAVLARPDQPRRRKLKIEITTECLSDADLHSALIGCHFIVATYICHVGLSHIPGLAARYRRPVLGLGAEVDPRDPDDGARGLCHLLSGEVVPCERSRWQARGSDSSAAGAV